MARFKQVPQNYLLGKLMEFWINAVRNYNGPVRDALVERDISRVDGTLRDPVRARRLLRSCARLQGTQATASVLRADLVANADGDNIKEDTIYSYLSAFRKLFAVEDVRAWCANLRCKTPIRTTDTRYFVDPSIATAALELGPAALERKLDRDTGIALGGSLRI